MTHPSDPLTPARLSEIADEAWNSENFDERSETRLFTRNDLVEFISVARQDVPDLLAEVDRLTATLASEHAKTTALTNEMRAYRDRGLLFTATELFKRDSANFDRGYAEHAAEIREAQK